MKGSLSEVELDRVLRVGLAKAQGRLAGPQLRAEVVPHLGAGEGGRAASGGQARPCSTHGCAGQAFPISYQGVESQA